MIQTSEKIQTNKHKAFSKIDRVLDRVEIDRPLLIKEKIQCIWADDEEAKK